MPLSALRLVCFHAPERITHENLRKRDPAYIESVDRWYLKEQGIEAPTSEPLIPPMFTPFSVGNATFLNRIVMSPMCQYSAQQGVPNDWHFVHYASRAIGGPGLIIAEMTGISEDARITRGCTGLWNDAQEAAWRRITDFVHTHSQTKIGIQLGHAGRKGATRLMWEGIDQPLPEQDAWPLYAASPIPYSAQSRTPQEITHADRKTNPPRLYKGRTACSTLRL